MKVEGIPEPAFVAAPSAAIPRALAKLEKGDYVLATKYSDGNPFDGWATGFYDRPLEGVAGRHMVVDDDGNQFRGNGFRRVERISSELGEWIYANRAEISAIGRIMPYLNMWRYKYGGARARAALVPSDPDLRERYHQMLEQVRSEERSLQEFRARRASAA